MKVRHRSAERSRPPQRNRAASPRQMRRFCRRKRAGGLILYHTIIYYTLLYYTTLYYTVLYYTILYWATERALECGVRAPVSCGNLREQTGENGFPRKPTWSLFLQKSPKVSGNLREFTGECHLGIPYSSSLLAAGRVPVGWLAGWLGPRPAAFRGRP